MNGSLGRICYKCMHAESEYPEGYGDYGACIIFNSPILLCGLGLFLANTSCKKFKEKL